MTENILIVGVGGQGTLLASRVLGALYTAMGENVKISEVHGMSQRGGSVVTYVRHGDEVASPIICEGEADVVLAFEQLEALRFVTSLKKGGRIIVNTQKIMPMPVVTGAAEYPADVIEKLNATGARVTAVDALAIAEKAGSAKAVNIALLGVMAKITGADKALFERDLDFALDLGVHLYRNERRRIVVDRFVDRRHHAHKHQALDDVRGGRL